MDMFLNSLNTQRRPYGKKSTSTITATTTTTASQQHLHNPYPIAPTPSDIFPGFTQTPIDPYLYTGWVASSTSSSSSSSTSSPHYQTSSSSIITAIPTQMQRDDTSLPPLQTKRKRDEQLSPLIHAPAPIPVASLTPAKMLKLVSGRGVLATKRLRKTKPVTLVGEKETCFHCRGDSLDGNKVIPCTFCEKAWHEKVCHPKMDAREFVCKECVKGTYGRPFARRVKMDVGVQTDGGYQPMRIQSSGRIGTVDEGEVVNWMDDEHCSACEKEMGLGEKASAFVGDEGGETIKMIERDPRRFEDVYTVVFARLCNGCKVECQKRQGFLANMNEETKTLLLLQCSVRFEELAGLLRQSVTPSRLVNFFLRKKGTVVCGGGGGGVVGGLVRGPFAGAGALGSVRGIPRLEAEIRRKTASAMGSYEDMLAIAMEKLAGGRGSKPKEMYEWMEQYVLDLPDNFRASAGQALKKGVDKGRFLKLAMGVYAIDFGYIKEKYKKRRRRVRSGEQVDAMSDGEVGEDVGPGERVEHDDRRDVGEVGAAMAAAAAVVHDVVAVADKNADEALREFARQQAADEVLGSDGGSRSS